MPGGCAPERACAEPNGFGLPDGPKRFGYFGALGAHAGVKPMIETFLDGHLAGSLEICGYGKAATEFAEIARHDPRIKFHGLLSPAECLCFGRSCDLLINPRPASHGNENNFASKLFDYALTGRAILTARLSGVEEVLGPEAFYFDPREFERSLGEQLRLAVALPRAELHRRGLAIQQRVMAEFSWERQGERLTQFLESICVGAIGRAEMAAALAA
jgi:glycosyltransferase involved in cell wall biosynthesis